MVKRAVKRSVILFEQIHASRVLLSNGQQETVDMTGRPWQRYHMYIEEVSPFPPFPDIPLHVAIITHILIAWDRMRWLSDPIKCRFPAFVCSCATWLTGMIIALPYPIYTIYLEMGVSLKNISAGIDMLV
uniref:Uncharacterized protein n=1 Tax=Glossina palpalis gambiensis TaxID=67801 RepID=A0A1B0BYR8_9MUSC